MGVCRPRSQTLTLFKDETNETLACENIRFSSLFAAGDVLRETSPAAKSEEKRMFSQANETFIFFI